MIPVADLPVETVLPRPIPEGAEIDSQQLRRARLNPVRLLQGVLEEACLDIGNHLFQVEPSGGTSHFCGGGVLAG